MSRHSIMVTIHMTDFGEQNKADTLKAICEGIVRNATEDYGIQNYEGGRPEGDGGYDGPFVTLAIANVARQPQEGEEKE